MACNVLGVGGCETKAGDILVVWGGKGVLEKFIGGLILTHLRRVGKKFYRTDFYIGFPMACPSVIEDDTGRIFTGCFYNSEGAGRKYAFFVSVYGYDGFERKGEGIGMSNYSENACLVYDRRTGKKFLGVNGSVLEEIEWKDNKCVWKNADLGMVKPSMDFLPDGRLIGIDADGKIYVAEYPFVNWKQHEEFKKPALEYEPYTCEIKVSREGYIYVAGFSKEYSCFKVEDQFGGISTDEINGYAHQKPALILLKTGEIIVAISNRYGATFYEVNGMWYASGLYLYISKDNGKTFKALPYKNQGVRNYGNW